MGADQETIPGWSRDQFSEIKIPVRFHNMAQDIYPDREGIVIRMQDGAAEIEAMRWGFPPPPNGASVYVTNVRNTASAFWKPWLKTEHRCIVPVAQFAEPDPEKPKPRAERWFARFGPAVLLLSWVPVVGDPLTVAAGVLRIRLLPFLIVVSIAKGGRYLVLAAAVLGWSA